MTAPILVSAIAVAVALSGCTPTPPTPSPSLTPTPTPTSTSVAPRDEPTPTPEQPITASCGSVFTAEEHASLTSDGLEFRGAKGFGSIGEKLGAAGAMQCYWGKPQTDAGVWFARLPVTTAEQATWQATLDSEGFTTTDDPFPGTLTAPADYDGNFTPVVIFRDGVLYFASYSRILGTVAELQ